MKGMHWGSRKGSSSTSTPSPSQDHTTVEAHRAKIKAGGVKALSNKELQDIVTRANLEQQHHRLAPKSPVHQVGKVLGDVLQNVGKQHLNKVALGAAAGFTAKAVKTKVAG